MEDGKSVYRKGGKYPYRAYGKCPYREGRKSPCHLHFFIFPSLADYRLAELPPDNWTRGGDRDGVL